jgi:beta-propeller repeat-containing protein/centrosomal CEP192-like protein
LSPHFPYTQNVFGQNCGGDAKCGASWNTGGLIVSNAFVTKLNIAGSALLYSGFLGYYEYVQGNAIAVDANGNAYVTGQVGPNIPPTVVITPPNFPPLPFPNQSAIKLSFFAGTFDRGISGISNAFVTEISSTGSSIVYSSYLGGGDEDSGSGIAVDGSGNAYVTGLAYSTDFPAVGALQSANRGGGDAFLSKVNTTLTGTASLVYSTLLGGTGLDHGTGVAADNAGNAYVAGVTKSGVGTLGFTPPAGNYQSNCALDISGECQGDAFVAKLNTNLTGAGSLDYFTYLGGTNADGATGIAVDSIGNAYVTGSTVSPDFPTTSSAFQRDFGGGNADAFVTKLDPQGGSLVYSSYLGGSNTDVAYGIAVDTNDSAYITGQTCSVDFPLANPLQSNPGGNCDAFISKVSILSGIAVNPSGLTFPTLSLGATSLPQTVTITNGDKILTNINISVTGANPGDFAATDTCGTSLPVGGQCTISVTFTPTAQGIRKASITITDSAPGSPQMLNLTGSTSSVILSASSLSFGTVAVGVTSAAQPVTVTNGGSGILTISGITASSGFGESDNCAVALQPGDNCVINVTYTPSFIGSSIGALAISDNAPGPQIVQLTGSGSVPSFTISPVSSSPPVSAGQTAPYTLMITPDPGFTLPVMLGCTGLPHGATCAVSSNPVKLNGPTSVQLIITTAVRAMTPPTPIKVNPGAFDGLRHFGGWLTWLIALLTLATLASVRRRPAMAGFGLVAILFVVLVGCSGGNSVGMPAGTPAGTYQITVTGTSGSITKSINPPLTLQVK